MLTVFKATYGIATLTLEFGRQIGGSYALVFRLVNREALRTKNPTIDFNLREEPTSFIRALNQVVKEGPTLGSGIDFRLSRIISGTIKYLPGMGYLLEITHIQMEGTTSANILLALREIEDLLKVILATTRIDETEGVSYESVSS